MILCKNCINYIPINYMIPIRRDPLCRASVVKKAISPVNGEDISKYLSCYIVNKDFNCQLFKKKHTFIEKLLGFGNGRNLHDNLKFIYVQNSKETRKLPLPDPELEDKSY